jgi:hypothetical protein
MVSFYGTCQNYPPEVTELMIGAPGVTCDTMECDGNIVGVSSNYQGDAAFIEVVKGLCPVKCGDCSIFCQNKPDFVNAWQSFGVNIGPSCNTAVATSGTGVYCNAEYQIGCAGDYGLCPQSCGETPPSGSSGLSTGALIGISIACAVIVIGGGILIAVKVMGGGAKVAGAPSTTTEMAGAPPTSTTTEA